MSPQEAGPGVGDPCPRRRLVPVSSVLSPLPGTKRSHRRLILLLASSHCRDPQEAGPSAISPLPTPRDSVSLQEPCPGATHSAAPTSHGTRVGTKGDVGETAATVPPPTRPECQDACGDDAPRLVAQQDRGAAVPRPWPGWPRCRHRRASPPRQPGTPLALPKCLIKGICGAAEPGCNLALTVHLFQRLRQSAKVAGSLITGRQAAGAAGRRNSCGRRAGGPRAASAPNEGDAFCPRDPAGDTSRLVTAALSQRPYHSQPTHGLAAR